MSDDRLQAALEKIEAEIREVAADERLAEPMAPFQINGPLALVQVALSERLHTLRRVHAMLRPETTTTVRAGRAVVGKPALGQVEKGDDGD
jgi:hypothetical protein